MIGRVVVVACLLLLLVCRTGICAQIASISRYSNFRNEDFKIYTPEGVSTVFEEALSLIQAHFYRASEFDDAFWAEMIRRFGPLANTHEAIEEVTSRLGDAYTKHIPEARARREAIRGDYVTAGIKLNRRFDWSTARRFILPGSSVRIRSARKPEATASMNATNSVSGGFRIVSRLISRFTRSRQHPVSASTMVGKEPTIVAISDTNLRQLLKIPSKLSILCSSAAPLILLSMRHVVFKHRVNMWADVALWLGGGVVYTALVGKLLPLMWPLTITEFSSFLPSTLSEHSSAQVAADRAKSINVKRSIDDVNSQGLRVGDQLVTVEGKNVIGWSIDKINKLLNQGKEGDIVEVGVLRLINEDKSTNHSTTANNSFNSVKSTIERELVYTNVTKQYALAKKVHCCLLPTTVIATNKDTNKATFSDQNGLRGRSGQESSQLSSVGYIAIDEFTARTCFAVEEALQSLRHDLSHRVSSTEQDSKQSNHAPTKRSTVGNKAYSGSEAARLSALVIDLQGNPGGTLSSALDLASLFLPRRASLLRILAHNNVRTYRSRHPSPDLFTPLLVLTDSDTASASEIFAAALRDNKRALIAGTKTLGKNIAQAVVSLSDDTALSLTVAEFRSPCGLYMGDGVQPDLYMRGTDTASSGRINKENIRFDAVKKSWYLMED